MHICNGKPKSLSLVTKLFFEVDSTKKQCISISTCADVKKIWSFGTGFTQLFLQLKNLSANNEAETIGFITSHFFPFFFFFFSPEEQRLASRALPTVSVL